MNFSLTPHISPAVFSVSDLNYNAKLLLEQAMSLLWVRGEISNLRCYRSGHWYFSLKDAHAQVRCIMFHHKNQYLDWQPTDGSQVEVRALVTLYESRGDFQLNVETIRRAGLGELYEAYEQLKTRLGKAGLFDPANKKPLPSFPKQVGVITSPDTAALHDILVILKHRMPVLPVIIYPASVQGENAAREIVTSIQIASKRAECDILILCRGGGSIEDLSAFNEEIVARAIANCPIPIITGIGHETDFTIADFTADIRAPTPTGAAQLACPDRKELLHHLTVRYHHIQRVMQHHIERRMQHIDTQAHRLLHPGKHIHHQFTYLQHLHDKLVYIWSHQIEKAYWKWGKLNHRISSASPNTTRLIEQQSDLALRLSRAISCRINTLESNLQNQKTQLTHLNPQSVLARGYSITYAKNNTIICNSKQVGINDNIQIIFAEGWCNAEVVKKP
ncbi:Exodeoxyribonuclease VII large subunit [Nitrosomonas cryotolerans]|uniref:Exodeoxyribonuclease 7 large subunit n=1 Tax=Nitrosomonas cryotolerans ATCC 49181 TaxID=1131553 RepID=A0A1N6GI39_9PROT|nr:exodeoxyribonuclease VII large subunit [Nitrosomonas cryotolerans]SFP56756.1 Exodeoxyribonuclease VII large subunit [Nitrosomonas cryotolerans]SIO07177.1 Exodeoxyribonuclease VII large subunit [Nitrosomonas cryotolerans ATCC 49181]